MSDEGRDGLIVRTYIETYGINQRQLAIELEKDDATLSRMMKAQILQPMQLLKIGEAVASIRGKAQLQGRGKTKAA